MLRDSLDDILVSHCTVLVSGSPRPCVSDKTWDRELIEVCSRSSLFSSIGIRSLETSWATFVVCQSCVEVKPEQLGG